MPDDNTNSAKKNTTQQRKRRKLLKQRKMTKIIEHTSFHSRPIFVFGGGGGGQNAINCQNKKFGGGVNTKQFFSNNSDPVYWLFLFHQGACQNNY